MNACGVDRTAAAWPDSATGPEAVISAPAVDIPVLTTPANSASGYAKATGTSTAAPIVAATAALHVATVTAERLSGGTRLMAGIKIEVANRRIRL